MKKTFAQFALLVIAACQCEPIAAIYNTNEAELDKTINEVFVRRNDEKFACVNYYNCDEETHTIFTQGNAKGKFATIEPRFGADDNECDHFLEKFCKVPKSMTESEVVNIIREEQRPAGEREQQLVADVESRCGVRNAAGIDFRLAGSDVERLAAFGEFPWMLEVKAKNDSEKRFVCGATLIAPFAALTAAHCLEGLRARDLLVRAGDWDTQTMRESLPYQERDVQKIITHKRFDARTLNHDVALLIFATAFKMAANVAPVCLPEQDAVISSTACYTTGWGKKQLGKRVPLSIILKKIQLPTVSHEDCQAGYRETHLTSYFRLHESFNCAGGEEGVDACVGDGGGPLVCPDPNNPNRYVLTGIVSWGIGCGIQHVPGVYANVAKYRHWVDSELARENIATTSYIV